LVNNNKVRDDVRRLATKVSLAVDSADRQADRQAWSIVEEKDRSGNSAKVQPTWGPHGTHMKFLPNALPNRLPRIAASQT